MASQLSIVLVGIGGYGANFVTGLLDSKERNDVTLVAVVDPFPTGCTRLNEIQSREIPIYATLEAMYEHHQPDLVVISSPIQMHCAQTVAALGHGSHVLCEKPLCATVDQLHQMIDARDRAGKQVAIGYQWSFAPTFHSLKRDIATGDFGAPIRLSTIVCWPRDYRYYHRNRWAGRQFDDAGRPVFDSPVNNACAHYLNNMFFVLGGEINRSATPRDVTAELFRANPIENYDTAAIRCTTDNDAEIFFFVTHATERIRGPLFHYEFENATVTFDDVTGEGVIARFNDGSVRKYGTASSGIGKLWATIDAIRNDEPVSCPIESASAQTIVMAAAQQSEIISFPPSMIQEIGTGTSQLLAVEGLEDTLFQCYREHKLPSELGVSWAMHEVPVKSAV